MTIGCRFCSFHLFHFATWFAVAGWSRVPYILMNEFEPLESDQNNGLAKSGGVILFRPSSSDIEADDKADAVRDNDTAAINQQFGVAHAPDGNDLATTTQALQETTNILLGFLLQNGAVREINLGYKNKQLAKPSSVGDVAVGRGSRWAKRSSASIGS